jgi:hypothetical protein
MKYVRSKIQRFLGSHFASTNEFDPIISIDKMCSKISSSIRDPEAFLYSLLNDLTTMAMRYAKRKRSKIITELHSVVKKLSKYTRKKLHDSNYFYLKAKQINLQNLLVEETKAEKISFLTNNRDKNTSYHLSSHKQRTKSPLITTIKDKEDPDITYQGEKATEYIHKFFSDFYQLPSHTPDGTTFLFQHSP